MVCSQHFTPGLQSMACSPQSVSYTELEPTMFAIPSLASKREHGLLNMI